MRLFQQSHYRIKMTFCYFKIISQCDTCLAPPLSHSFIVSKMNMSSIFCTQDAYAVLDYSKAEVPQPRNDEVGLIDMKIAVGAAEENLKRVKDNFAHKISKVKKR